MSRAILLGTRSKGKLRELGSLLAPLGVDLITLDEAGIPESPDEDRLEEFHSFEENALAKARYFSRIAHLPVVADDSGLEVAALSGRPGVHSKRWSGLVGPDDERIYEANRQKLLGELRTISLRQARFVCCAVFLDGDLEIVTRGVVSGRILHEPRGSGGFGYDPLFLADELGATLAECSVEEKARVSHRGRAFTELVARLRSARWGYEGAGESEVPG